MTDPTFWNQFLIWPILNLLVGYYKLFEALRFPGPLGFAIILLTLTVRVVLYPLMATQMKSARKMAKLKPHIDELSKKHKDDKQALQQAQLALYKEHGVNPAGGCLPLLIQMPILIALYNVFYTVFQTTGSGGIAPSELSKLISNINQILYTPALKLTSFHTDFFGFDLAVKPSQWQNVGWWLLAIPVITALLQWYQTKLMMDGQTNQKSKDESRKTEDKRIVKHEKQDQGGKPEEKKEDMAMEMQKQMAIISPIMFAFFSYQFPVGLALYWNIFGLFGIIQQRYINKKYG